MRELLLFGVMLAAVLLVIGAMVGWHELVTWHARRAPVKSSREVMSYEEDDEIEHAPSAVRQTEAQTDRQPVQTAPSRDIMLNTYKFLRKYGAPREEARAILRALNLPLDNNLWTAAAPPPPEEPPTVTPIAGRETRAKFHDDPELEYRPL